MSKKPKYDQFWLLLSGSTHNYNYGPESIQTIWSNDHFDSFHPPFVLPQQPNFPVLKVQVTRTNVPQPSG